MQGTEPPPPQAGQVTKSPTKLLVPYGQGGRLVHVFSGVDGADSLGAAVRALGRSTVSFDVLVDPGGGDVLKNRNEMERLAANAQTSDVWWFGTPCASFSRIRGIGVGPPAVRDRLEIEGLAAMMPTYGAYIRKHNTFVEITCTLMRLVWIAGGTVIVENPEDCGDIHSPGFRWTARHAPSMWLMPAMINMCDALMTESAVFPQCALGGLFQKWTRLVFAGPRAHRLRALSQQGLTCACERHAKLAAGFDDAGVAHSAGAAAYPPLMNGIIAALCFTEIEAQVILGSTDADALLLPPTADPQPGAHVADDAAASGVWKSAHLRIPQVWEEAEDVEGNQFEQARRTALQYVSRRRLEPEAPEVLFGRRMPAPTHTPDAAARPIYAHVPWPTGAPARPIHISQLFKRGEFLKFETAIAKAVEKCRKWERFEAETFTQDTLEEWAQGIIWNSEDPNDVCPLQPFSKDDPVQQGLKSEFFLRWGGKLNWPDKDMLRQTSSDGLEGHTTCDLTTTIFGHHGGLRNNPNPAIAQIKRDTEAGFVTEPSKYPRTIPTHCVPKNIIKRMIRRLDENGKLVAVQKDRVSTDDSMEADGAPSRNASMARDEWHDSGLPGPRTLAEAVATAKSYSRQLGLDLPQLACERIALWVLDLVDAYRVCGINRAEWWLQSFVWTDGIRLDKRAVFGSAHLPGLFQRITSFVIAVVQERIRAYDAHHLYSAAREEWLKARGFDEAMSWASIYLDDGFGLCVLGKDEPLRGRAPGAPPVTSLLETTAQGGVRLLLFASMSRPEVHCEIAFDTIDQAGWEIQRPKVQLGFSVDLLGLGVSTQGEGMLFVPEAKRLGMLEDVEAQLQRAPDAVVECARSEVETLTGRCGHIAIVAAEANAYLAPMWRISCAKRVVHRKGRKLRIRPARVHIGGSTPTLREYQSSLRWWHAALSDGFQVPLAPKLTFPSLRDAGVAFFFTDAAREDGTGFGAFSFVEWGEHKVLTFPYIHHPWPPHLLKALQQDELSMAAGELFGNVAFATALIAWLPGVTHVVCFTDSSASMGAINSGNSPSLQMNSLVQWLFAQTPHVQFLAVHQQGKRNERADAISRHDVEAVLAAARAAGAQPRELALVPGAWEALDRALRAPQRH